ncbi:MAG: hypothetical protein ABI193_04335 [Minicystis sp.]
MIIAKLDPLLRAQIKSSRPIPGVRAGSAVVWSDERLLVVQDDASSAAWVDPGTFAVELLRIEGDGGHRTKAEKLDFEAAFVAFGGTIYILGSGSTKARRRVARVEPFAGAHSTVLVVDCTPLFEALEAALGGMPNIEGAVLEGSSVRLFHRGCAGDPSATMLVPLRALEGHEAPVSELQRYDLGSAAGVPLTFTDAAPCGSRTMYLAVAEETPNAVDDGPIAGAAVGLLDGERASYTLLLEPDGTPTKKKVEGVAFDPRTKMGYLVTDPDDPKQPAELCAFSFEGF